MAMTEQELRAITVGELRPLAGKIEIAEYDPAWLDAYVQQASRIRAALGDGVVMLEHVGSTSVPGLAAKPRIDILLVVASSADEPAYVPALEAAGYVLHLRERAWHEHRLFKHPDTDLNLHVFSPGCPEIERMRRFRDWLRHDPADRALYERTKRELGRDWRYGQEYADAKTEVVEQILTRALAAGAARPG